MEVVFTNSLQFRLNKAIFDYMQLAMKFCSNKTPFCYLKLKFIDYCHLLFDSFEERLALFRYLLESLVLENCVESWIHAGKNI